MARNASIFQDINSIPDINAAQGLSILSHFPQDKGTAPVRFIQQEQVDFSRPWAYFDGASQNNNAQCVGGAVLHLSDAPSFKLKMGLGPGTNNYAELMSLKLLLLFAGEKGVKTLQIFGDSMIVINWTRKTQKCHNIQLLSLLDKVFRILDTSYSASLQHVYRERNKVADKTLLGGRTTGFWEMDNYRNQRRYSL